MYLIVLHTVWSPAVFQSSQHSAIMLNVWGHSESLRPEVKHSQMSHVCCCYWKLFEHPF